MVRIWTKTRVPAAPVFWVSSYHIEVDALLGLPVFEYSKAAPAALERRIITKITKECAQEMDEAFAKDGEHAVKFLEEQLDARWATIARQYQEYIAGG